MTLSIKNITMKNFMSIGAVTQTVRLDENKLTLILGDNIDLGSEGSRNGVGKSVIIDALSFVLFGVPVRKITAIDRLVNMVNKKNMLVTLEFEKGGHSYKIERGRKPNILKFYVDGKDYDDTTAVNEAQGENRETQPEINKIIGISPLLFKHIIVMNTKTIPFLDEGASKQREIIEELLGITQLSEKAEILKDNIKQTKTEIEREEYRHKLIEENNKKTKQTIDQITIKSNGWETTHSETLAKLEARIEKIMEIDIDAEIQKHKNLEAYNTEMRERANEEREFSELKRTYNDVEAEARREVQDAKKTLMTLNKNIELMETQEKSLIENRDKLLEHKCPACGQDVHDDKHTDMVKKCEKELEVLITKKKDELIEIEHVLDDIAEKENVLQECIKVVSELKFESRFTSDEPVKPSGLYYDNIHEAYEHKNNLDNLIKMFEKEVGAENPHIDQIKMLEENNIQEIDYTFINELVNLLHHQEFLLKLLTRKDSNIRMQIVEQNLAFLNSRLDYYCKQIGLPHQVYFLSDLSVDILKLGQSYDCGNLSGGESTRLVLALSWAFRDVHEALNESINLMFIDELIDSGMDAKGAENALAVLKQNSRDHKKNIFLISHRDDFVARVSNVLIAEMANNFTDYRYEVDIQI